MVMENISLSPLHRFGAAVLVLSGLVCIGCGPAGKVPDKSQQATISGKVTLDGSKPAPADTNVVFFCGEKGATVSGKVDALGSYNIKAGDRSVGIPAGRYQVMIRPGDPPAAAVGTDDYKKAMMGGGATTKPESTSPIPAKFHAFDTAKIALEVKPGNNTFDLDLSKL